VSRPMVSIATASAPSAHHRLERDVGTADHPRR
jgi:hypothetical protein